MEVPDWLRTLRQRILRLWYTQGNVTCRVLVPKDNKPWGLAFYPTLREHEEPGEMDGACFYPGFALDLHKILPLFSRIDKLRLAGSSGRRGEQHVLFRPDDSYIHLEGEVDGNAVYVWMHLTPPTWIGAEEVVDARTGIVSRREE